MSDNNLYDALDDCLAALRRGDDIESCLARHAQLADDLRPLLAAAAGAQSLAVTDVPVEAAKRGRARLLNQAAELRERAATSTSSRLPAVGIRFRYSFRLALSVVAAVLVAFALGGVGLVFASSGSLPGDRLYPIKLSFEGVRLKLAAGQQARATLQEHFDDERVGEVDELAKLGRAEDVNFGGLITGIFPGHIIVSNITVLLVPQTRIEGTLALNAYARVQGLTQPDGLVVASEIKVRTSEVQPEEGDSGGGKGSDPGGSSGDGSDDGSGSSGGSGSSEESTPEAKSFDLEGSISSVNNGAIVVAGKTIVLQDATEVRGTLREGVTVRVRGVIRSNGSYIASRVEVLTGEGDGGGGGDGGDGGGGDGGDDNGSGSSAHATPQPETFDLEGAISSMNNRSIVIDGKTIQLNNATEIRGSLAEGVMVRARGTIGTDGRLIATRVEVTSSDEDKDG